MQRVMVNLKLTDTVDGINQKICPLTTIGRGRTGEMIVFTLAQELRGDIPACFVYKDQYYMVDKEDAGTYECVAINFVEIK